VRSPGCAGGDAVGTAADLRFGSRWKIDTFFVSILSIALSESVRCFIIAVVLSGSAYVLDGITALSSNADDQVCPISFAFTL
jgi:hypothetical protein